MTKSIELEFDGKRGKYYSLGDTCSVLSKARSTIMRLLPKWEAITRAKPRKDHSGRWFIPEKSVHALRDTPALYLKLAGRATKWEGERCKLRKENKKLRVIVRSLVGDKDYETLMTRNSL